MKKKGQVVSVDLIIGVSIFLFAFSLFYGYTASTYKRSDVSFDFASDYLFEGIELGLDNYQEDNDIDFFGNNSYSIDVEVFGNFKNLNYSDQHDVVLGNVEQPLDMKQMDFCMYIKDKDGIVLESMGEDSIFAGKGRTCGDSGFTAKPSCPSDYTHAVKLARPVVYGEGEIVQMNVLICGVQL